MRAYHVIELLGILLMIGSVAVQLFYLEPITRSIEWNRMAFIAQQSGQIQVRTAFDNRIMLLKTLNAPAEDIAKAEEEKAAIIKRYVTADANVADSILNNEDVEKLLQILVMITFALGTLMTAFGRIAEMRART